MNCKNVRDIILTDYLDGQLESSLCEKVEKHLSECRGCLEFASNARLSVIEPFERDFFVEPPRHLWNQIKSAIEQKQKRLVLKPLLDGFLRLIFQPRPIFAFSSAFVVVLVAVVLVGSPQFLHRLENRQLAESYLNERAEFFASSPVFGLNGDLDAEIFY